MICQAQQNVIPKTTPPYQTLLAYDLTFISESNEILSFCNMTPHNLVAGYCFRGTQ